MIFDDHRDAGRQLARELSPRYGGRSDVIVLALPRGGVPVGYEVALALGAPLDAFLVRKLGVPGHKELAMGAIASGGVRVLNDDVVRVLGITDEELASVTECEQLELERRERLYRGDRSRPELRGRTVLLVDDGLATGTTMRAAVSALRSLEPARIVVAVPVASPRACEGLEREVDEIHCLMTPEAFHALSLWFRRFAQFSDDEVRALLESAARRHDAEAPPP